MEVTLPPLTAEERAELARLARSAGLVTRGVPVDVGTLLAVARAFPRLLADLARVEGERDTLTRLRDGFLVRRADASCPTCCGSGCAPDGSTCDCYGWAVRGDLHAILWDDLRRHDAARKAAIVERDTARAESARLTRELAEARATIENERGEGEPPSEGWVYWPPCGTRPQAWVHMERDLAIYHHPRNQPGSQWAGGLIRGDDILFRGATAREAMRNAPDDLALAGGGS